MNEAVRGKPQLPHLSSHMWEDEEELERFHLKSFKRFSTAVKLCRLPVTQQTGSCFQPHLKVLYRVNHYYHGLDQLIWKYWRLVIKYSNTACVQHLCAWTGWWVYFHLLHSLHISTLSYNMRVSPGRPVSTLQGLCSLNHCELTTTAEGSFWKQAQITCGVLNTYTCAGTYTNLQV